MRLRCLMLLFLWATLASSQTNAFSVPPADAPELAASGTYSVGVGPMEIKHAAQPDILNFDKNTGKAPLYDRPLTLEIWYPAIPDGKKSPTTYEMVMPGPPPSHTF